MGVRRLTPAQKKRRHELMLLRRYGLTADDYARMMEEQGGLCAICRKGRTITLSVDHEHLITEEIVVRGLLCQRCNRRFVGSVEWSNDVIRNGIKYLEHILEIRRKYNVG